MKRILLTPLFILAFATFLSAAEVKNLDANQVGNRVLFEYDVVGDKDEAEVIFTLTIDGKTYTTENLHLEGDYGKVKMGEGKKIWWNVLQDFPTGYAGNIEIELVAKHKVFDDFNINTRDVIIRVELVLLLINDLRIEKIFAGRIPAQSRIEKMKAEFIPFDVADNPFKDKIMIILGLKIKGLEPEYDANASAYLFKPNDSVKRKDMLLIIEDILTKVYDKEKSKDIIKKDFYSDVMLDTPVSKTEAYNAINLLKKKLSVN